MRAAVVCSIACACNGTPAGEGAPAASSAPPPAASTASDFPDPKPPRTTPAGELGHLPDGVGIAVGSRAPDFELEGAAGRVKLSSLREKQHVVLFFYQGGWNPHCHHQVRSFQSAFDALAQMGMLPVGVSVDAPSLTEKMHTHHRLGFPLLSDPDLAAHNAYRVATELDRNDDARLRSAGIDIERWSQRDHRHLAMPAVFLIDRSGIVRFAHASRDDQTRPDMRPLLTALHAAVAPPGEPDKR